MAIMLLLRHGRTQANADGILAGWTPGLGLDDTGREQAQKVSTRLAGVPIVGAMVSPLQRCQETAQIALSGLDAPPDVTTEDNIGECRYGSWTGKPLKELSKEPLWKDVQKSPSTVHFPPSDTYPSESMTHMQERAVAAIRAFDAAIEAEHGPGAIWLAVSHGDVIKSILADAAGTTLDNFQRIVADPASLSIIRYTNAQPFLLRTNDTGSDPINLTGQAKAASEAGADEGNVGGGAGHP